MMEYLFVALFCVGALILVGRRHRSGRPSAREIGDYD